MTKSTDAPTESRPPSHASLEAILHICGRINNASPVLVALTEEIKDLLPTFIAEAPLGEAFDTYNTLEDSIEALADVVKKMSAILSLSREVLLPERMDNEQIPTLNTEILRASRTTRTLASIRSDNIEAAYQWLRDNEYGSLIKETVNSSSLSSLAKEIMGVGKELPEDIFTVHLKAGVSITIKKKK